MYMKLIYYYFSVAKTLSTKFHLSFGLLWHIKLHSIKITEHQIHALWRIKKKYYLLSKMLEGDSAKSICPKLKDTACVVRELRIKKRTPWGRVGLGKLSWIVFAAWAWRASFPNGWHSKNKSKEERMHILWRWACLRYKGHEKDEWLDEKKHWIVGQVFSLVNWALTSTKFEELDIVEVF